MSIDPPSTAAPSASAASSRLRTGEQDMPSAPSGELVLRTAGFPADTNPDGDIFGGWLLSQMDLAGGIAARRRAGGRAVTVALDSMVFHNPVKVGDVLSVHTALRRVGRSSMTFLIQAWVSRAAMGPPELVTEGTFTYVAIDETGKPRPVPPES